MKHQKDFRKQNAAFLKEAIRTLHVNIVCMWMRLFGQQVKKSFGELKFIDDQLSSTESSKQSFPKNILRREIVKVIKTKLKLYHPEPSRLIKVLTVEPCCKIDFLKKNKKKTKTPYTPFSSTKISEILNISLFIFRRRYV